MSEICLEIISYNNMKNEVAGIIARHKTGSRISALKMVVEKQTIYFRGLSCPLVMSSFGEESTKTKQKVIIPIQLKNHPL